MILEIKGFNENVMERTVVRAEIHNDSKAI